MDKSVFDKLKREDIIPFLDKYYESIGRAEGERPDYRSYTLIELKKCLQLFGIQVVREV
jgi:hypothetical protein